MALSLISKVWPLEMQSGRKFVLVAICDAANDDGACFMCVETIAYKCGMSVRAVQGHLVDLEKTCFISRDARRGRSSVYSINLSVLDNSEKHEFWQKRQRGYATPAESAPPQNLHKTPAESAPPPAESAPRTITYPSLNGKSNGKARAMLAAMGVSEPIASDWIELRKTKKAAITQTALDGIQREAVKARFSLEDALRTCCERGWSGFNSAWLVEKPQKVSPQRNSVFEQGMENAARAKQRMFGDQNESI